MTKARDLATGIPGGLVLVKTQTIGTAVTSVVVADAFSATYDAYYINVIGGTSSTDAEFTLKLGATTTGYYSGRSRVTYSGATTSTASDNNATAWNSVGFTYSNSLIASFNLLNPFGTKNTFYNNMFMEPATSGRGGFSAGYLNNSTSYTEFTLTPTGGTITGGTISIYGYRK